MKRCKRFLSLLAVIVVIVTASSFAYTDTWSDYKTTTLYGYTYEYCCLTSIRYGNPKTMEASTLLKCERNAPAGYMGAQARLYTERGTLVTASDWVYNTSPLAGYYVDSDVTTTKGNYYSYGRVKLYNGNGYNDYYTYQSPIGVLNSIEPVTYKTNKYGDTYGTGVTVAITGEDPDFIEALGVDGTFGYVRSSDLESKVSSPRDALLSKSLEKANRMIPLYDEERNVIGQFEINTRYSEYTELSQ
ncbi:hypothetical protein [Tissierella pigra]|uniref:Uncharacterized protein n=1 Tax=Tissierella pigra TaxID=2607614 RepID=A0A6N7Y3B2_9FIRM|nr:hypothetical protein [Tissierella pigra]MSU03364.1 hypothetical protein [Tissierella pigra]